MHLTITPGFVYVFFSISRPQDVKIGKAILVEHREFELQLADPDIKCVARMFFLDVFSAEAYLHNFFAAYHVARETFKVSVKEATAELERYFESRRAERLEHLNACRFMADIGELKLDQSKDIEECNGSALSVLLSYVPNTRDGRNVKSLVPLALSGGSMAPKAAQLLQSCGLMVYPIDGMVLLDKSNASLLEKTFKNKPCLKTWREQLAKFAGFNESVRSVAVAVWTDITEAGQELVDKVNPIPV